MMDDPAELPGPDRGRADEPRRAFVRHLLAPAEGPDHLPRHADRRRGRRTSIMAQLLHLESEDPDKDINLYINSPGGDVDARCSRSTTRCSTSSRDVSTIVHGPGGLVRRRSCCSPARRASASRCRTRGCCCTSRTAARRARPSTSRSRPSEILALPAAARARSSPSTRASRREGHEGHRPRLHPHAGGGEGLRDRSTRSSRPPRRCRQKLRRQRPTAA